MKRRDIGWLYVQKTDETAGEAEDGSEDAANTVLLAGVVVARGTHVHDCATRSKVSRRYTLAGWGEDVDQLTLSLVLLASVRLLLCVHLRGAKAGESRMSKATSSGGEVAKEKWQAAT